MFIGEGVESCTERIVCLGLLVNEHQDKQEGVVCQRRTHFTRVTIRCHQWPQTGYGIGWQEHNKVYVWTDRHQECIRESKQAQTSSMAVIFWLNDITGVPWLPYYCMYNVLVPLHSVHVDDTHLLTAYMWLMRVFQKIGLGRLEEAEVAGRWNVGVNCASKDWQPHCEKIRHNNE